MRWAVHTTWWSASPLKKVRACRRYAADREADDLPLRASRDAEGQLSVGVGGTKTCATWHSCMGGCSQKIAMGRAADLDHVFRVWEALGGQVVALVFSLRHHAGQRLRDLLEAQRAGRDAIVSARPWKRERERLGIRFVLWAFEGTYGDEAGWHPHYHVFALVDPREWTRKQVPWGTNGRTRSVLDQPIGDPVNVTAEYAESVLGDTWQRWCEGIATKGATAVDYVMRGGVRENAGFHVTVMSRDARQAWGRYPFKLALEAVGALWKKGGRRDDPDRQGKRHRTPFEVMTDYAVAAVEGRADDAAHDHAVVSEWSRVLTELRVRQCPFPPGMRAWFAEKAGELHIEGPLLEDEQSDEQLAEEEAPDAETIGHVRTGEYRDVIAYEMDTMRRAARTGGIAGLVAWFDTRGLMLDLTELGERWRRVPPEETEHHAPHV